MKLTSVEYDTEMKQMLVESGAVHLRGTLHQDADLDFYVSPGKEDAVLDALQTQGFFEVFRNASKIQWQKIVDEQVVRIDLALNFDYIFKNLPQVRFRQDFLDAYLVNRNEHEIDFNAVRYLFLERNGKKYLDYLNRNRQAIVKRDSFKKPLAVELFGEKITSERIINQICDSCKIRIFPFLRWTHRITYLRRRVKQGFSHIGRGRSVAVLGPDGSGKSTVVGYLSKMPLARSVYMGSDGYLFDKMYARITKQSCLAFRVFKFLAVYLENWLKIGKISLYKIRGKTVYMDRYPSYQPSLEAGRMRWFFRLFYRKLYPMPDQVVILVCSEARILERKDELDGMQIRAIYEAFQTNFANCPNAHWIENDDLNTTLSNILGALRLYGGR